MGLLSLQFSPEFAAHAIKTVFVTTSGQKRKNALRNFRLLKRGNSTCVDSGCGAIATHFYSFIHFAEPTQGSRFT